MLPLMGPVDKNPFFWIRFAQDGILFTNETHRLEHLFAAPQCSPSRAAILMEKIFGKLEEARYTASYFPKKYPVFTEFNWRVLVIELVSTGKHGTMVMGNARPGYIKPCGNRSSMNKKMKFCSNNCINRRITLEIL